MPGKKSPVVSSGDQAGLGPETAAPTGFAQPPDPPQPPETPQPPEQGEAPGTGGGRRAAWTLADQALSSLTNAALAIVVAHAVGRIDFGAFSLALITYGFAVGLARATIGDPFVVRFSAVSSEVRRAAAARAGGASFVFGVLAGLICLVAALFTSGPTRMAFAALALSLPGLIVQDTWRHMFFAAQRPAAATLNDFVWAVLQFGGLTVLLLAGSKSVLLITLVWGGSATVASAVAALQTGVLPRPRDAWRWMVETRDLNVQLGTAYVVNQGALQVGYYSVGGIVGVVGVGALRAAQVLLGPLNLLFAGFNSYIMPVMARRVAEGKRLLPVAVPGSLVLGATTAVWLTVLVLLPDSIGVRILGDSWAGASAVMLPTGLVMVGLALALGASNSLVTMSRTDLSLRITAVQAPMILVLGVVGAWQGGAAGAAWGFAVSQAVGLVLCWILFLRVDARPAATAVPTPTSRQIA